MRFASHAIRSILSSFYGTAIFAIAFVLLSSAAWAASVTAHFSAVQIQVASCTCYGVAVDASGNVYIADTNNNKVWKETLSNGVYTRTLVAGSFNKPYGIAVDKSGNVYVADTDNNRIIKETLSSGSYTSSGVISGLPTSPYNVAVDANGNVYVAGGNSSAPYVYKLTPNGSSYTKTNILGASSGMQTPWEVNLDSNGNVFVTDAAGNSVYKLTLSGSTYVQSTVATGLNNPMGVAVDAGGKVYVSNANTNQIVLETPSGSAYTKSVFATGPLDLPYQLAVDANGSLYIANPQMGNILHEVSAANFGSVNVGEESQPFDVVFTFDSAGTIAKPSVVTQGAANLDFGDTGTGSCTTNGTSHSYAAGDVCIVSTDFYPKFAGARYGAVVLKDSTGAPIATALTYGTGVAPQAVFSPPTISSFSVEFYGLSLPSLFAIDPSGNFYVGDVYAHSAVKEIPSGCASPACVITLGGGFSNPQGLALDGSGNVYVADLGNESVKQIPNGCTSSACVTSLGGGFLYPTGIAVDGSGNVYVGDSGFNAPKEIPVGCTASRFSNNLCTVKTLGGGFNYPGAIAVDIGGNVYAADWPAMKEIPAGCVSSACIIELGGDAFTGPNGITVDADGSIYVADASPILNTLKVMPAGCASSACVTTVASGFYSIAGAQLDGSGNIYVADGGGIDEIDRATPPSLAFPPTLLDQTSGPLKATIHNIGNSALTLPLPSTGDNPSVSASFLWDDASTCDQTDPSSPEAFSLAPGASCTVAIDFAPTSGSSITGSVVLTDDALNAAAPNYATQTISMNGSLGTPASLSSPTPNSVLAGADVTFNWNTPTGGASKCIFRLGTTPGAYDLYGSGATTNTSVTVLNLPTNGETIYARLLTIYNSGPQMYTDYTLTAAKAAALTLPASESTFGGPRVTFKWSAATGVISNYILRLGTTPGAYDIYGSGPTTVTSIANIKVPTNGETIYVRLLTNYLTYYNPQLVSEQVYHDYTFTAATVAALTSPAPSTVLPGATATFKWSAATGGAFYILRLGTTGPGSNNLFGSGQITATTVTRTNLPTNGETIYARLLTIYPSGEQAYNDYTFTAAKAAALTSPAPNSTLPGPTVTFNWSAATGGPSSYILRLGTTQGAYNLFGSGQITAATVTPTRLPTNGETIYARLLTIYPSGAQVYNDYTFTAAP